jgi:glutamate transport system substrate-binding protein
VSPSRIIPAVLLATILASCVPAEPDNDEMKKFNAATTVMGRVQKAGALRVGLPSDRPAFATTSSTCPERLACGINEGFTYELAAEVAGALGVEMEVQAVPNDDLIGLIDNGDVDLAFPMTPITEKVVRKYSFTDPYLVGHQRVMVKDGSSEDVLGDLAGADVCEYVYPEVGLPVESLVEGVRAHPVVHPDACGALFLKGEVEAAVGADLALAGILPFLEGTCGQGGCPGVPPLPQLAGDQLTTEGYGALVPSGEATWRDFVTQVLEESQQEGRWSDLYETWLQPLLGGDVVSPPGMTVEEAAALYPADL